MTLDLPETCLRLGCSIALGGVVGLERQVRQRPAGLRTLILICLGSTLFTIASVLVAETLGGDPGRVASNIVTGIGFLGAGAIIRGTDRDVLGLTTAASIFAIAAVGMLVGFGLYLQAALGTLAILITLTGVRMVEDALALRRVLFQFRVRGPRAANIVATLETALADIEPEFERLSSRTEGEDEIVEFCMRLKTGAAGRIVQRLRERGLDVQTSAAPGARPARLSSARSEGDSV
jgi:uncharacterized membrane protein YhiD involved in acid resistance